MKLFLFSLPKLGIAGVLRAMNETHATDILEKYYKDLAHRTITLYTLEDQNTSGILTASKITRFILK